MKHIHFIGICGVAMSALALAFKKAGWQVTGSDVGIYPPISDYLKKNKVDYYTGWHPDLMCKNGEPDLVIVGNVASSNNSEWLYTQTHKLEYKSYPELIAEYFVRKNSIVCAGTYGKTTTAALLSWILTQAGLEPSYMFGGLAIDEDFPSAICHCEEELARRRSNPVSDSTGSPRPCVMARDDGRCYSVLEGDEYKTARWDNRPKFAHYSPTHLLLTAVEWDHADVYPTEDSYFAAFESLVKSVPKNGTIVANEMVRNIVKLSNCQIVTYGHSKSAIYQFNNLTINTDGIEFNITLKSKTYHLKTNMLGDYMAENITGAFAMACEIGIKPETIIKAIGEFKGLKRRLEKRFEGKITIFDDIAHSPAKAESTLKTLASVIASRSEAIQSPNNTGLPRRLRQPADPPRNDRKIIAIFEPNTGNRQLEAIPSYDNKFNAADLVIIPELTHIKHDQKKSPPLEGEDLKKIIGKTHSNVEFIEDDKELVQFLIDNSRAGDVIVFLGSHGFRGMIEMLVNKFVSE
ncbi:MAG: hypothetical protein HY569_01885 [Candidatus Magasanikbacteria bacterium]|nr:hypothetical protein [Candidatus Magasanikbacteria bacterium]